MTSPDLKHYAILAATIGGVVFAALEKAYPAWAWLGAAVAVCGAVVSMYTPRPGDEAEMAGMRAALSRNPPRTGDQL